MMRVGKIDKKEVVTATSAPEPPKPAEKPVEKKPDPKPEPEEGRAEAGREEAGSRRPTIRSPMR